MLGWSKSRNTVVAAALLAAVLAAPGGAMAQNLDPPATVTLEFLDAVRQGPDWLDAQLAERGLRGRYEIADGRIVTDDPDVLGYLNRIRTFAYLDRPRTFPWFSLNLTDASGATARCVTLHPRDYLPELGVLDFRSDVFMVEDVAAPAFDSCRVAAAAGAEFATLDRAAFRERYFGQFGELDMGRFEALSEDPAFVARAIDLGFFPLQGSFTGYLQIALDEPA